MASRLEAKGTDLISELRAEIEPILADFDFAAWVDGRDWESRRSLSSRLRERNRQERIMTVMSLLTVT